MENQKRLFTKEQAAGYLQISLSSLDRLVKGGTLTPTHIGKKVRFPEDILSTINTTPPKKVTG